MTLLVLAAGMGSRYGGLKQLDPMGPAGEALLDYSVYDALREGFGRVVFVIRRAFEEDFRTRVGRRFEERVDVDYVFQEMGALPAGFAAGAREKPWGTGHAIWCGREAVKGSFGAINADDFYGGDAFAKLSEFFAKGARIIGNDSETFSEFAMVGYRLGRTLSDHGTVARGVCQVDGGGYLESIRECTGLERHGAGARMRLPDGGEEEFTGDEAVSMNCWGFTPAVFPLIEERLGRFLQERGGDPKAEYYIPDAVTDMVRAGKARVTVLRSEGDWFGVTYREDKPLVTAALERLTAAGEYPAGLWSGAAA